MPIGVRDKINLKSAERRVNPVEIGFHNVENLARKHAGCHLTNFF
jgi:hypothetical protein